MNIIKEIKDFTKYCNEFYNLKGGVYPIATKEEIDWAINTKKFGKSNKKSYIYKVNE